MKRATVVERVYDFGGQGPVMHLAHANGFPPGAYRPLAETLAQDHHVIGLPARPLWPGSRPESAPSWHALAEDLMDGLDGLGLKGVIGVGHSMGGVCTMLAAIQRPDLFRAVVLIDPVILPPSILWLLRALRWLGLRQRIPVVQGALRRRRCWPSRATCYAHYRGKATFRNWSDASLEAYVEAATRARPDGQVELAYSPEWEAHIYATAPTDIWRYVQEFHTRALVIRGEHTDSFLPASQRRMERLLPQAAYRVIPGAGHLVALERPAETGAAIRAFLGGALATPMRVEGGA